MSFAVMPPAHCTFILSSRLSQHACSGVRYLLDAATGLLYHDALQHEWPMLVGLQKGSRGVSAVSGLGADATVKFFTALDAYLKTNQVCAS
jgi:hypothetical protein